MLDPDRIPLPSTGLTGFEVGISDDERALQDMLHRFAVDVMRPLGRELDKMTPEDVVDPSSPIFEFHRRSAELGIGPSMDADPKAMAKLDALVFEELGYGDPGLSTSLGAGAQPALMAQSMGDEELIGLTKDRVGCWVATQPSRGSDGLILYPGQRHPLATTGNKGDLTARLDGDEVVINGQSSAWVSNGPIAGVGLVEIAADYGDGFFDEDGHPYGIAVIVPFDRPGVSKGKPLHKIGKRALPQGEIFFDEVRVPKRFMMAGQKEYEHFHTVSWGRAGTAMANVAVGVARSALEQAVTYASERKQGGAYLADQQLTRYRLGKIGGDVEMIRAFARYSAAFTYTADIPHPYFTARVKAACTNIAFDVVNESLQLLGGYGLAQEYPLEKMLRDARAMMIEDGENVILHAHFGYLLTLIERQGR